MAKGAIRRKGAAQPPRKKATPEQRAQLGLMTQNYSAGMFASCAFLSISMESSSKTMYYDIGMSLITILVAAVVGLSPGIDNIHSFIKGARTEPKNRQALAGMVLILGSIYYAFGMYGPCGLATVIMLIAAVFFAKKAQLAEKAQDEKEEEEEEEQEEQEEEQKKEQKKSQRKKA